MAGILNILIVGAGGFGREVYQYLTDMLPLQPSWKFGGFLDRNPDALRSYPVTGSVVGSPENYMPKSDDRIVIAIGEPAIRRKTAILLAGKGAEFTTIVHPSAYVSNTATIGDGVVICPFAFVGPDSNIGAHSILNTYASVGHDGTTGEFVVLSPYAVINGNASLSDGVFMGTHATVVPGKTIGAWSKIGAGAVVTRTLEPGSLALGNPATSRVLYAKPAEENS
jgi:sugar O-acyltransferase (sialic acid O-acetyltransferase NeuD family)